MCGVCEFHVGCYDLGKFIPFDTWFHTKNFLNHRMDIYP
jgi:hypothetical protein